MAVPEQHHFFLKRPRPLGHAVQPPAAQFHQTLKLHAHFLLIQLATFVRRCVFGRIAQLLYPFGVGFCPFQSGRRVGILFVIKQGGKSLIGAEGSQLLNDCRRAAEAGPIQQMRRRIIIPAGCWKRFKHTFFKT